MKKLLTILAITILSGNIYAQKTNIYGTYLCEYSETIKNGDGCCTTTIKLDLKKDSSFYIMLHDNQGDYECFYYSLGKYQLINNKIFFISQIPDTSNILKSINDIEEGYFKIRILRNRYNNVKYLLDNLNFCVYDNPLNIEKVNSIKTLPDISNRNIHSLNSIDTVTFYFEPFNKKYFNVKLNDNSILNLEIDNFNKSIFFDMTGNYCYWEYYDYTGFNLVVKKRKLISTYEISLPSGKMIKEKFKLVKNAR